MITTLPTRAAVAAFAGHRDELADHLSSWPAPRPFKTLAEAIDWLRTEITTQRRLGRDGFRAFNLDVLRECRKRLVLARYFRRFGEAA